MSERKIALDNPNYQRLKHVYENRFECARLWKQNGDKVVATIGSDVPEEVLTAARIKTLRVFQDRNAMETPVADAYLEGRVLKNKPILGMFENLVNGVYDSLADHIVISNSEGCSYGTYNVLREFKRISSEFKVPSLYFVDLLFTRYHVHLTRNERIVKKFKEEVEKWTGIYIDEDALKEACRICNENREALRAFNSLRSAEVSRVTGEEALVVIGSSLFMDKEEHTALVQKLTEDAKTWPELQGVRVFFTGTDQQYTDVYHIIESAGGHIVAEDHNWGGRHYDADVKMDVPSIKAISDRYTLRMSHTSRAYVHQRVEDIKKCVAACGAEAVIFYLTINDDAACWDYPNVKKALDEQGVKSILLYSQPNPVDDAEKLKKSVEEFLVQ